MASLAILVLAGPLGHALLGQQTVDIQTLRENFDQKYKNEQVAVFGWVAFEKPVVSRTFKGYYFRDRYGQLILIRTTAPLPDITSQLRVVGVALRDADSGNLFVSEVSRSEVLSEKAKNEERMRVLQVEAMNFLNAGDSDAAAKRVAEMREIDPSWPGVASVEQAIALTRSQTESKRMLYLGGGVASVGILLLVFFLMRRKAEAPDIVMSAPTAADTLPWVDSTHSLGGPSPGGSHTVPMPPPPPPPPPPPVPGFDDFKTVRVYKTTKVLPGILTVLDGAGDGDTLFLSDQSGRGDIEIGRDSPDASGGIRIKDPTNTLSRHQARITYLAANQEFNLTNTAGTHSNPTVLNGRELKENESIALKSGDVLVMGNVRMRFTKK